MTSYAVIGASRGIGLEYVRQLAGKPNATVFAVVRNAQRSTHLQAAIAGLKNVHVLEADVADYKSLEAAAKEISKVTGGKLDCLIHNAAMMELTTMLKGFDDFASMDELDATFIDAYKTNALGVIHSISAFLPLLRSSSAPLKKIISIGTEGGDPKFVYDIGIVNSSAYGMTKAAAWIATVKWALKLKDEGFVVVSLSPGLVDTMGTKDLPSGPIDPEALKITQQVMENIMSLPGVTMLTPEQSVARQIEIIDKLKPSDNGSFISAGRE